MRSKELWILCSLGLSIAALGCGAKSDGKQPCPGRMGPAVPDRVTCTCEGEASGSVWGDRIYTTDSVLCAAAVHAGAAKAGESSLVTAVRAAGCAGYNGREANGVRSKRWGAWDQSFYFEGHGDGACQAPTAVSATSLTAALGEAKSALKAELGRGADALDRVAPGATTQLRAAGAALEANVDKEIDRAKAALGNALTGDAAPTPTPTTHASTCPRAFGEAREELTCTCDPADAMGRVYGSHPYTSDSSVCAAAKHAGLLASGPTRVTARRAPGCDRYESTDANGVVTTSWGRWSGSFVFPAAGEAACPN